MELTQNKKHMILAAVLDVEFINYSDRHLAGRPVQFDDHLSTKPL